MKTVKRFRITYEIVTDNSAYSGDVAYRGFLPRTGQIPLNRSNMPRNPSLFTLKQAVQIMNEGGGGSSPVEADSCPCDCPRWLTRQQTSDQDRPCVSLSLHIPEEVSRSSARRIARLFNCYGLR